MNFWITEVKSFLTKPKSSAICFFTPTQTAAAWIHLQWNGSTNPIRPCSHCWGTAERFLYCWVLLPCRSSKQENLWNPEGPSPVPKRSFSVLRTILHWIQESKPEQTPERPAAANADTVDMSMLATGCCINATAVPWKHMLLQVSALGLLYVLCLQTCKPHFPRMVLPLYIYFPTRVSTEKSITEHARLQPTTVTQHWCHLFYYILQSRTDITFRRSPPEQYSMARRGTSLTRKFISLGTSQALTTLGWFNLSTQKAGWKLDSSFGRMRQQIVNKSRFMFYVWGFSVPQIYPCWGTHSSTGTYQYPNT